MFQLVFILISVSVATVCIPFLRDKKETRLGEIPATRGACARVVTRRGGRASEEERVCGAPLLSHTSTY
jgi:hypothetical protein